MINIGVCISGEFKNYNLTNQLFQTWNSLFSDVNFKFFYYASGNLTDIPTNISWTKGSNTVSYAHSLQEVHKCRASYKNFDIIIQTRPDVIIFKYTLDYIRDLVVNGYDSNTLFVGKGLYEEGDVKYLLDDNVSFGSSEMMDKYSKMYQYGFIENKFSKNQLGPHRINAACLDFNDISVKTTGLFSFLIRDKKLFKNNITLLEKGYITPEILEEELNNSPQTFLTKYKNVGEWLEFTLNNSYITK
jgi:hypothetical protein